MLRCMTWVNLVAEEGRHTRICFNKDSSDTIYSGADMALGCRRFDTYRTYSIDIVH